MMTLNEKEEARKRLAEIQDILYNNLYTDGVEEGDLLNEKDYLEELLLNED